MLAFFRLRRSEPDRPRPFRAPGHPFLPAVALALSTLCLVSLTLDQPRVALVFVVLLAVGLLDATLRTRRASATR